MSDVKTYPVPAEFAAQANVSAEQYKDLRRHLARWRPERILMLGCDPATWARDAGFLGEHGYHPRVVEIFDLFPSTHHLEILAMMERA